MKNHLLTKLIAVRLKGMIRNLAKTLPGKKKGRGALLLFGALMLYSITIFVIMFIMLWDSLIVLCTAGFSWLYFALCGLLAAGITVLTGTLASQNQLYNAADNALLLSMPIPPGTILLSRMAILLTTAFGSAILIFAPAVGVYIYRMGMLSAAQVMGLLLTVVSVTLAAQALSCVLGWLFHRFLGRVKNKALASLIYMILFLAVYFVSYSQLGKFLTYLAANGDSVAAFVKVWASPFYVLGMACSGNVFHSLLLITCSAALFALIYRILSHTFIRSVQSGSSGVRKTQKSGAHSRRRSPSDAVFRKELRRFLTCSVYLTNNGLGVLMILASACAVPFFRDTILGAAAMIPMGSDYLPLFVPAFLCILNGMSCLTAPSVSLEGKNLWILRSMPITGKDVLTGKLKLHLIITGTATTAAGLVLSAALGCSLPEIFLVTLLSTEISCIIGMLGLIFNLLLPNFRWLNETSPCKQDMPVLFVMLSGMGIAGAGALVYSFLAAVLTPLAYLSILTVVFAPVILVLYRTVTVWGSRQFESFPC